MNINDIKDGDTLLVRSEKSWLSNTICKVMTKWAKRRGFPKTPMYSHAARFVWIEGKLYVFGSVDNGYQPWEFNKHYDWDNGDFAIMRRKEPLTEEERKQTIHYMLHLDTISISYQYWNFIQWLLLVYLRIDTFGRDSQKFMYCYESERECRKNLNPENYMGDISKTDIFDLLYDPFYEVIYKSKQ
jgi:hypothetical protein